MKRLLGILFLLFLYSSLLVTLPATGQESVGLADTPWPMYQHDAQHTGRSPFVGIMHQPVLLWIESLGTAWDMGGMTIGLDGNLLIADGVKLTSFDPIHRQPIWQFLYDSHSRAIPLLASDGNTYQGRYFEFFQLTPFGQPGWAILLDENYVFGSSASFGPDGNIYVVHDGLWSLTQQGDIRWVQMFAFFAHASPAIGDDGMIYAGGGVAKDICAWRPNGAQYWCLTTPNYAEDASPSIDVDGDIILASDAGSLYSIHPTGQVEWEYQTEWVGTNAPSNEAAISPDGTIYFTINPVWEADGYLYAVAANGNYRWQAIIPPNPETNLGARFYRPPITDQMGNVYLCAGNSRCYGIASDGSELWQFEFPFDDSIVNGAGMAPLIAADGLMFFVDAFNQLYAYADPELYPLLSSDVQIVEYKVELGADPFTVHIPIESTIIPINYSVVYSDEAWLSIRPDSGVTPDDLVCDIDPSVISTPGIYQAEIRINPQDQVGRTVVIPVELNVSATKTFLPMINKDTGHYQLVYLSTWYNEGQLATNQLDGEEREIIAENVPTNIQGAYYSQDSRRMALVYYSTLEESVTNIRVYDTFTGAILFEIPNLWAGSGWPSWSPDGDRFVTIVQPSDTLLFSDLFIVDSQGAMTRLTYTAHHDQHPSWSPTGEWIAFSHDTNVNLIRPDGSDLHTLPIDLQSDYPAGWSPDGRYLLIIVPPRYPIPSELWVYDLQTSNYWRVAQSLDIPETTLPAFSPDGTLIAYVGYSNYLDEVMVTNLYGSATITVTPEPGDYRQLSWSPSGYWLSYVRYYNRPDWHLVIDYDIYAVRPDGSSHHVVTTNIGWDRFVTWRR